VGSTEHHATERAIAEAAVTVLKNDGVLPLPGEGARVVILGRTASDATPIEYALAELQDSGVLDANAHVVDRITGKERGDKDARTQIYVERYYDLDEGKLVWTDETSQAIGSGLFAAIEQADPEVVVTDCETCKWQIEMSTGKPVMNPISVLAEALDLEATAALNK
jgi:beta-glucosidase-like glycosyl hydrolase